MKKAKSSWNKSDTNPAHTPTSARLLRNRPPEADEAAAAVSGPEQVQEPELLADPVDAVKPSAVQNGRISATYLSMGLEREKQKKLVHLDFSFPLEKEHAAFLPVKVKRAWDYLRESGDKLIQVEGIPQITLDIYQSPTSGRAILHLVGASFRKAIVSVIEEVGKGKTIKRPRFAFRLIVERTEQVLHFCAWNDGADFWITIPETQSVMAAKGGA